MNKKLILVISIIVALGLLLSFTPIGFITATFFGIEFYDDNNYKLLEFENDGNIPLLFDVVLGGSPPKRGMIIPGFVFYSIDQHETIIVQLEISENISKGQYIDLNKLVLTLENGEQEDLLPSEPVRLFLGVHEFASRYQFYIAGEYQYSLENFSRTKKGRFDAALWPPTNKITLLAEGALVTNEGKKKLFKQVSEWEIERSSGFHKKSMP